MSTEQRTLVELVFDGDCALCRASVRWLERRDVRGLIRCTPSADCTWPEASNLPLSQSVVSRDAAGRTSLYSSAVGAALVALPGKWGAIGRLVLRANRVQAIARINDAAYRLVAKNRLAISRFLLRVGLLDASCAVRPSTFP